MIRALLPYLEQLATSHGCLADVTGFDLAPPNGTGSTIQEINPADPSAPEVMGSAAAFTGFAVRDGWGQREGPVPEAFLPPFHWGYAPATRLIIDSPAGKSARLAADVLTYAENQSVSVELNGVPVEKLVFNRLNQKERLQASLALRPGRNELVLGYGRRLVTDYDPRQLAVIFLSLRIVADGP